MKSGKQVFKTQLSASLCAIPCRKIQTSQLLVSYTEYVALSHFARTSSVLEQEYYKKALFPKILE